MDLIPILVVEDDMLLQEVLELALEDGGYDIKVASHGGEAMGFLETASPQFRALITDINLHPGSITGWDIARRARELYPDLPVIYMTGASAHDWTSRGVPHSVLLTKPFAPAQVVTAVSQLLNTTTPTTA